MYWMTLLVGLGLFVSPFILGIATHMADTRISVVLGVVVISASLWEFGEPGRTRWPPTIICLAGLAVLVATVIVGLMGHMRMLGAGMILGTTATLLGVRGLTRRRALE